jgi:putative transposase
VAPVSDGEASPVLTSGERAVTPGRGRAGFLRRALAETQAAPGLAHHSDRGAQRASGDCIALPHRHQAIGSMGRKGDPFVSVACESFVKTLKPGEIFCCESANLAEFVVALEKFLERYDNRRRLQSALN